MAMVYVSRSDGTMSAIVDVGECAAASHMAKPSGLEESSRPVHRLDRATSGLDCSGKNDAAQKLAAQFSGGR